MKQYDVMCPECGTVNKGLYLEETNGWMICEHCGTESCSFGLIDNKVVTIPLYDIKKLPRFAGKIAV